MELAVTKLAIICFFVIGVSHIVQSRVWAQLIIDLRGKVEVGSFLNALLHFPLGVLIVFFHNLWLDAAYSEQECNTTLVFFL